MTDTLMCLGNPKAEKPLSDFAEAQRVLDEVFSVRLDQVEDYSQEHDDKKDSTDWYVLFEQQITHYLSNSDMPPRRALINLAALAVAAVSSYDRKQKHTAV